MDDHGWNGDEVIGKLSDTSQYYTVTATNEEPVCRDVETALNNDDVTEPYGDKLHTYKKMMKRETSWSSPLVCTNR